MTLQNDPPGLDYERDKKFSRPFKQMIAMCLVKDPSKRPSAQKLLKQPFFKQARSHDYFTRRILEGLLTLGDRHQALKEKEEDMLAQKKFPDGKKEEMSQIPDNEENSWVKDQGGCSNYLFELEQWKKEYQNVCLMLQVARRKMMMIQKLMECTLNHIVHYHIIRIDTTKACSEKLACRIGKVVGNFIHLDHSAVFDATTADKVYCPYVDSL